MTYKATDFKHLLDLDQFSNELMNTHLKLYDGYVKNTNKLTDKIQEMARSDEGGTPEFAELHRRFGWEFNGMRLHEYYFGNMTPRETELEDGSDLGDKINTDFGSFNEWKDQFTNVGTMRGIGWACLYHDPVADKLVNTWIDEHDTGQLAGCAPILLMDVFEHAFIRDFGTDRDAYMRAFFESLNWNVVSDRYVAARELVTDVAPTIIGSP